MLQAPSPLSSPLTNLHSIAEIKTYKCIDFIHPHPELQEKNQKICDFFGQTLILAKKQWFLNSHKIIPQQYFTRIYVL